MPINVDIALLCIAFVMSTLIGLVNYHCKERTKLLMKCLARSPT